MRRLYAAGLAAMLTFGVAACSGEDPEPRFADPSETPSPSTTAESPPSAEPTISPQAEKPTRAGAVAFTSDFWAIASEAQISGDISLLKPLMSDGCTTCQGAIQGVKETTRGDREVQGGEVSVIKSEAQIFSPSDGVTAAAVQFTTKNAEQTVSRNGKVVKTFRPATLQSRWVLTYTEKGWRVDIWRIGGEQS